MRCGPSGSRSRLGSNMCSRPYDGHRLFWSHAGVRRGRLHYMDARGERVERRTMCSRWSRHSPAGCMRTAKKAVSGTLGVVTRSPPTLELFEHRLAAPTRRLGRLDDLRATHAQLTGWLRRLSRVRVTEVRAQSSHTTRSSRHGVARPRRETRAPRPRVACARAVTTGRHAAARARLARRTARLARRTRRSACASPCAPRAPCRAPPSHTRPRVRGMPAGPVHAQPRHTERRVPE